MRKVKRLFPFVVWFIAVTWTAGISDHTSASMNAATFSALEQTKLPPAEQSPTSRMPKASIASVSRISHHCDETGNAENGSRTCRAFYSNGITQTSVENRETIGTEFKKQIITQELDASGNLLYKRDVRQKIEYLLKENGQREKIKEFYDIVNRPAGKKITRGMMFLEYDPAAGRLQKSRWTQYRQIGNTKQAELIHHVVLSYDASGNPLRGRVEKWKDQRLSKQIFVWSKTQDGMARWNAALWNQWESRLQKTLETLNIL